MASIRLENVEKRYGNVEVIRGLNLNIPANQLTVLLGPSGCGKSTLLRIIAGLEEVTAGSILIDGKVVNNLGPKDRGCAMVFQSYALYPHKSVYENLAFPLRMERQNRDIIDGRVKEIARQLQIEDYLDRRPRDLSGGQRQRVAMGRAMIRHPKAFLFDEPLSNLDAELRVKLRLEIGRLQRELGATMVFVTHDQVEAMTLAHSIVVMKKGVIQQQGSPLEIYEHPTNRFVASFIGSPAMNFFPVDSAAGEGALILRGLGIIRPERLFARPPESVGIRPEHLARWSEGSFNRITLPNGTYELAGIEHLGDRSYAHVQTSIGDIAIAISPGGSIDATTDLDLTVAGKHIHGFDAGGRAL